jgi:sterol desaturase/sphingolipid hydroxylase (fatty acid hydroxylase superfamily)
MDLTYRTKMLMWKYIEIFFGSFSGYWFYLVNQILYPSWHNYFYWLVGLSLFFYGLEIAFPWRKHQPIVRKDFWQDMFYMFFNFFLFSLIGYNAISNLAVAFFNDLLHSVGIKNLIALNVSSWSVPAQLFTLFIIRDFIQWNIHRLLHRVPALWEIHKIHHSVVEMGFAAHLRYNFMENVVYRFLEYLPLAMIGYGIEDFFLVHIFTLAIGHFNHANIKIPLGVFKYIVNNPQMHLWHHVKKLPDNRPEGINFGITLSFWDYLFGKNYQPYNDPDLPLGFENVEKFPDDFMEQQRFPFQSR